MVSPRLVLVPIIVQIVHLLQRQETGEDMRWMWVRGGENGGRGGDNQTASRKVQDEQFATT